MSGYGVRLSFTTLYRFFCDILSVAGLMSLNLVVVFILYLVLDRSVTEHTTIAVRKRDKQVFEQALDAVSKELGEEPTHSDALREISEAYCGRDACGRWQNGESDA